MTPADRIARDLIREAVERAARGPASVEALARAGMDAERARVLVRVSDDTADQERGWWGD